MKSICKRTFVLFLALLMAVTALPVASAQENDTADAAVQSDAYAQGENPLADVIASAVNERRGDGTSYGIFGVEMDGLTADVTCYAPAGSTVAAAIYDEADGRMVTSGTASITEETEFVRVALAECELPEYYTVKVFLLAADHSALCTPFVYERYTQKMQAFYAVTPEDFKPEQVVLYHNASNFAAVNEDVTVLTSTDTENTPVPNETADVFTFSSPGDTMKSLKKGDRVYIETSDSLILGTVASAETDKAGNVTLKITPAGDALSYFAFIHVDSRAADTQTQKEKVKAKAEKTDEDSEYDKGNEFSLHNTLTFGFSWPSDPKEVTVPADWSKKGIDDKSLTVDNDAGAKLEIALNGSLTCTMDIEYCYHIKWGPDEYWFNMNITNTIKADAGISVTGTGSVTVNLVKLDIPTNVPGLTIYIQCTLSLSITGTVSSTVSLSVSQTTYRHSESADPSKNRCDKGKPVVSASSETEISVNITAELKVAAGAEIAFGVVKVGVFAKLTATAGLKPLVLSISNQKIGLSLFNHDWHAYYDDDEICAKHDCSLCLKVDLKLTATFGIDFGWFLTESEQKKLKPNQDGYVTVLSLENKLSDSLSLPIELLHKTLRVSLINGVIEKEWMDGDVACPHMRFLTKINVAEKDTKDPLPGVQIGIYSVDSSNIKLSEYASIPKDTVAVTDEKGVARCYLPAAAYGFAIRGKDYKIESCSPDNKSFLIRDDRVVFDVVAKKSKDITISVVKDDTREAVPGVTVYVNLETFTADAAGKLKTKLFPGEEVVCTVLYQGKRYTIKNTVPYINDYIILEIPSERKVTGLVVDGDTGAVFAGVAVAAESASGEKVNTATGADGRFTLLLEDGEYSISFSKEDYETEKRQITVSAPLELETVGLKKSKAPGGYIQFGTYPQSRVRDTEIIARLDAAPKTWKSYNYYTGTGYKADGKMTPSDYMQFADFFMDGSKYRAVYFTSLRPYQTGLKRDDYYYQERSWYGKNTVYYFLYEPIVWRVLDPNDGLILAEMSIDSQAYQNTVYHANDSYWQDTTCQTYASDYATSSIRSWLNYDFYETAFSDIQKSNIRNDVTLNNESWYNSTFDSISTMDKVFLLSYAEATNSAYGFSESRLDNDEVRVAEGTDYARCQGLCVNDKNGKIVCAWRLRSPCIGGDSATDVAASGAILYASDFVGCTSIGVRPACRLSDLKSDSSVSQTLFSETGAGSAKKAAPAMKKLSLSEPLTYTHNDCVKGEKYVLLAVKDAAAKDLLAAGNLLYIDQQTAEGETLTFRYVPRETGDCTVLVFGPDKDSHTHSYTAAVTKEPTCAAPGERTYTCLCGDTYTEVIPATGKHTWDTGKVTKDPTATAEGERTFTCTVCGAARTEPIPKQMEETPAYTPGDVNGDGRVTAADARLALRRAVGLETYEAGSAKFLACDVDGNGKVTAADARRILRAAVGLETLK